MSLFYYLLATADCPLLYGANGVPSYIDENYCSTMNTNDAGTLMMLSCPDEITLDPESPITLTEKTQAEAIAITHAADWADPNL